MASAVDEKSDVPRPSLSMSGARAAADSFTMPFQPGEVIVGKYKVVRLIGTGGVGFVVSARHVGFDEVVALKFLRPEFATHSEAVMRFTIEARASFRIRSEHVARVLDVDTLLDGTPFIAMELLEGTDLRSLLDRCRMLAIEPAVDYALQTCEALAAAHSLHVIHRDIKPENLFLTGPGDETDVIKVLDFGISKVALTGPRQTNHALTRIAVGTPPYMSPEQVRASSDLDARSDIWSLGCVLYELLTGTAPFDRMSLMQSCAAVLEEEPVPLRDLRPVISKELSDVVMSCLQKDPNARYQDVAALAEAHAPFGSGQLVTYPNRCRAFLNGDGMARRSTPSALPPIARRVSLPPSLNESSVHRRRTGMPASYPTGMPARYPTSARPSAHFPNGTLPRQPTGMTNSMRRATGHSRLPTGVGGTHNGLHGEQQANHNPERMSDLVSDLVSHEATTRPTVRIDTDTRLAMLEATLPPAPTRWPWTLGIGATLAFVTAYLLSHAEPKHPTIAHVASAARIVAPSVQSALPPTAAPTVAVVEPPTAALPVSLDALPQPPAPAPEAAPTLEASASAIKPDTTASKPKTKLATTTRATAAHKLASTTQASDEIDVGF